MKTTTENPPRTSTRADQVAGLVDRLAQCERGRQALGDLRGLLKNGGCGLDAQNAQALRALIDLATSGGCAGTVLDALYIYRHETR